MQSPILVVLLAGLMTLFSAPSWAQFGPSGWYLSTNMSGNSADSPELAFDAAVDEMILDSGRDFGISLGHRFIRGPGLEFRTEVESTWRSQGIGSYQGAAFVLDNTAEISLRSSMINSYVELANSSGFIPYLGMGLGVSSVELKTMSLSEKDKSIWSAQFMAGISYTPPIADRLEVVLGRRLLVVNDAKYSFGDLRNYEIDSTEFGFRYKF